MKRRICIDLRAQLEEYREDFFKLLLVNGAAIEWNTYTGSATVEFEVPENRELQRSIDQEGINVLSLEEIASDSPTGKEETNESTEEPETTEAISANEGMAPDESSEGGETTQ